MALPGMRIHVMRKQSPHYCELLDVARVGDSGSSGVPWLLNISKGMMARPAPALLVPSHVDRGQALLSPDNSTLSIFGQL